MAEFPDLLINPNPNAPTLDASANQVRGINFFDTIADRDALDATVRTLGALAVIKDVDELYQYTGATLSDTDWQDAANWLGIGSAGGGGVQNLNNLNGNVSLVEGTNVTLDVLTGTNEIQINASGGGGSTDGIDVSFVVRDTPYANIGDHEGTVLNNNANLSGAGNIAYWTGTQYSYANASAAGTATGLLVMLTANTAAPVLTKGVIRLNVSGSAGDVLYLSTSQGAITNDISAFTTGQVVRVIGYNMGGGKVYFDPSNDWIEIA